MSETMTDAEWLAKQRRQIRNAIDDIDRHRKESNRRIDEQNRRMRVEQERTDRRGLGFLPIFGGRLLPTLVLSSLIGGLIGFGVSALMLHGLDAAAVCTIVRMH